MAKRFTDSTKYKKPFMRSLPAPYKLFWDYLYHDCDHAGIWIVDFEVAQVYLGKDAVINKEEALRLFNKGEVRVVEINNGKQWFLPKFVEFQYGGFLSEANRVHLSIIRLIRKMGLEGYVEIVDENNIPRAIRSRLTQKKKDEILARDEFMCQYCSNQFPKSDLSVDHIIPVTKGGNNEDDNLATACAICNSRKSDLDLVEFYQKWGDKIEFSEKIMKVLDRASKKLEAPCSSLQAAKDKEQEKEQAKSKDKEKEKEDQNLLELESPEGEKIFPIPKKATLLDWWNTTAKKNAVAKKLSVPDSLYTKFKKRCAEGFWDSRGRIAEQIGKSSFLREGFAGFSLDWLLKNDSNWVKVAEGSYRDTNGNGRQGKPKRKPSLAEMPFPK